MVCGVNIVGSRHGITCKMNVQNVKNVVHLLQSYVAHPPRIGSLFIASYNSLDNVGILVC